MRYITAIITATVFMAVHASAEIISHPVDYKDGDVVLEGFVAYDDALDGPGAGVMIVHDWDGLGEYERSRAIQLAQLGYTAFAVDIYGKDDRPATQEENAEYAGIYYNNPELYRKRLNLGLEELKKQPTVIPDKTAAIGYCFGGMGVLELARSGAETLGVVSFHGSLGTKDPSHAENIKCPVIVMHGADDPIVPEEELEAFMKEMKDADVDLQLISFSNTVHSFTVPQAGDDPSSGVAYNERADNYSWEYMKVFFDRIFGG